MSEKEIFESLKNDKQKENEFAATLIQKYGSLRSVESATGIGRSRIARALKNNAGEVATTIAKEPIKKQPKKATGDILANEDIKTLKELITLIEPIKEVINSYYNPVIPEYNKSITIDKSKLKGEIVPRQIKTYESVNNDWKEFCKKHDNIKIQDLYSMALIEYMKNHK